MNKNSIIQFSSASEIRNAMKQVQQLSWTITQFEKKYPFDSGISTEELEDFINAYLAFGEELRSIYQDYERVIEQNPLLSKMLKMKRNEQRTTKSRMD